MNIFNLGLPLADGSGYRPRVNSFRRLCLFAEPGQILEALIERESSSGVVRTPHRPATR